MEGCVKSEPAKAASSEKPAKPPVAEKLAKLTIAPTLSTGPDYWNRPELRFYVTTAKWNAAANAANGAASANHASGRFVRTP